MTLKPRQRWILLLTFMLAHGVNDGFGWVIPPLLPAIREHFHLSYTEMGALLTSFRFFGNVLQAPVSYLVYFVPTTAMMVGGLLWTSLGMFVASFSASYWTLVWISALSGVGRATYHPLAVTILSRSFGRESLGRAMALHLSGSAAGQVVAPFLVGLLLSRFSWRVPIQVWCAMGVVAVMSLFFFLRTQREALHAKGKALRLPFFSRSLGIYLAAVGVWGIAQSGLMTFLPLLLVDYRSFAPGKAAAVYGIMSLSGALCRPFMGALMDWMGRRKPVIIGGFIGAGLSLFGLTVLETPWMMYGCIMLMGIFGSGHSGLADTLMIEMIPSHRREETLGFIYTVRMGTGAVAPIFVGFVSERIGLPSTFMILAIIPMFTALALTMAEEKPVD